jgi:Aerotolerance regulator N-terminal
MALLDSIGLLNPHALRFLWILPALILAYLARERPRQATVSSVLAFRALHVMRGQRFGGRPRLTWTFFLELLALLLAVLAMAAPYLLKKGNPVAVVIDNSAAMQALTPAGKTRFENAIAAAGEALDRERGSGQVTVYATSPQPHQLGGLMSTIGEAKAAIARAQLVDSPDDPAAVATLLGQLVSDSHIGRVIFASYRAIAAPVPAKVIPLLAGDPIVNYAIGSFALSRESFGAAALHARLTVANFSPTAQTLRVTITGDNRAIGAAQANVDPGAVNTIDLPNIAPAQAYRAQLEPSDGFALDNVAYATGATVKSVAVLFVSPTPADGAGLRSIPGITVETRTPSDYAPKDLANFDLAIFEYTAPKELPAVNTLLVMPPPGDSIFNFAARPTTHVEVAGWPTTDTLTDGVNFRLLNFRGGEYLGEHPWMQSIVTGDGGGLMLSGSHQGHRFIATGFNPFPYLGRGNLPMSILTLNMLGHLAGFGAQTSGYRTGEPWMIPAGVKAIALPSGRKETVQPGTLFNSVTTQGVYQLIGANGQKTIRAVNLADLTASDLANVPPISVPIANVSATSASSIVRAPLASYILAAILALIVLESLIVYRRRRVIEV